MRYVKNIKHTSSQKGFTLIELLVSVLIFTFITTVAVYNNVQFNSSVLLTNLAYEVALSVRQAQFYGITVKQATDDPTIFDSGYGIHFDTSTPNEYLLFEDENDDVFPSIDVSNTYDLTEPVIDSFKIQKGNGVKKVCVFKAGDLSTPCPKAITSTADITFVRPNPDAYIRADGDGESYLKAEICVASPSGTVRKVIVERTGQISVSADTNGICI